MQRVRPTAPASTSSGSANINRDGFLDSTPAVVLAAAAARTKNIRLTSAVTVLSAIDPVRAFESFATLDLISNEQLGGNAPAIHERRAVLAS